MARPIAPTVLTCKVRAHAGSGPFTASRLSRSAPGVPEPDGRTLPGGSRARWPTLSCRRRQEGANAQKSQLDVEQAITRFRRTYKKAKEREREGEGSGKRVIVKELASFELGLARKTQRPGGAEWLAGDDDLETSLASLLLCLCSTTADLLGAVRVLLNAGFRRTPTLPDRPTLTSSSTRPPASALQSPLAFARSRSIFLPQDGLRCNCRHLEHNLGALQSRDQAAGQALAEGNALSRHG